MLRPWHYEWSRGRSICAGKDCWGRGLMPEAVQAVIRWLFTDMKLDAILCGHFNWNAQSARVQQKCGFHPYATCSGHNAMGADEPGIDNILRRAEWEAL